MPARTTEQRMLNAVQHPEIYEEVIIESKGVPVALSIWKGQTGSPCIIFLPGTMTHPLFYEEFLDGLALAGFNVVGVHLQGHGKSPRTRQLFSLQDLVQNARDAITYTLNRFESEIIVLGSSQGGVIAMALAGSDPRPGLVVAHNILNPQLPASLSITRFPRWFKPAYPVMRQGIKLGARLLPRLPLPIGFYLQPERIFRTKWASEQYQQDPLSLTSYPLYFLASLFNADMSCLASGQIKCPVVVVASTGDTLFPYDYTRQVYEQIVAPTKELLLYELKGHLIFNEDVEEVLPAIVSTINPYLVKKVQVKAKA
ncbi:MAG TPA: alpha/beta fold hydrolase [Chloroflexia bacterium]|nr:alpha/beta fold hydrolase [Chloroflexia bacterium]